MLAALVDSGAFALPAPAPQPTNSNADRIARASGADPARETVRKDGNTAFKFNIVPRRDTFEGQLAIDPLRNSVHFGVGGSDDEPASASEQIGY